MSRPSHRVLGGIAAGLALALLAPQALAYISQVDGTVVPVSTRMQQCLDRAVTGEGGAGIVDALADARIEPEAYRPVENPVGSGQYPVTFRAIGEGAGYRNSFGWVFTDVDPTNPANLNTVFGCRPGGSCACPCDPNTMRPGGTWQTTIDFATVPGFVAGRALTFFIRSPERIDGSGTDPDNCGNTGDVVNRIYFTSKALNDDGDYIHFLVYRSVTHTNSFYFGFEDLFRGGDNDFEDMLVRADGLVPLCDPQPETCNGDDDDCDLAIDEGITRGCSTACGSGMETCTAGTFGMCTAPTPSPETCNALDDDCDTRLDEGLSRACSNSCGTGTEVCIAGMFADCTAPTPTIENCDGNDDDCDGMVDEMLSRACFTACGSGTETCVAGSYAGCDAPLPSVETCDGSDDDCDGRTDEGLTRPCTSACGMGIETCISGSFVGCTAPSAGLEACNDIDDDCDGTVDEGLTRACSTACGVGTEMCSMGAWVGCDAPSGTPEVCNNVDDDCNGVIDDGNPGGGEMCIPNADGTYTVVTDELPDAVCRPGMVTCVAGELLCLGSTGTSPETCNCDDDDCDGAIDEGTLCGGTGACIECVCASPCGSDEFPCPPGRICDRTYADPEMGIIGYCVQGMCAGVTCTEEEECDPLTGECVNLCSDVMCPPGFACVLGRCLEDNCYGRGCPAGERCRELVCEPDPCASVSCGDAEFCREGTCVDACPTACTEGQVCRDGACVADPCGGPCGSGEHCVDGSCVADACVPACLIGRVCRGTTCIDDPCADIECPTGTICTEGDCAPMAVEPPPPPESEYGLVAGGGGFVCSASSARGAEGTPPFALGLALLALAGLSLGRRRRRALRAGVLAGVAAALSIGTAGCAVDPFCFGECGEPSVDAGPDASAGDSGEECRPVGEEMCNGVDDDCNGTVDDGFDLQTDPENCGECALRCIIPNAFPGCEAGECTIATCESGWVDLNESAADGCEYECQETGDERCDEIDNDCDGTVDESFDTTTDRANCGRCGNVCVFPNAEASCEASTCVIGPCRAGYVDLDDDETNGCEYACGASGTEACNSADDDCDAMIDEGFVLDSDPMHCGRCGNACVFPNASGICTAGVCGVGSCTPGFHDIDGDPATGCEYPCTSSGMSDTCNGDDDDCDGRVDEADPDVGSACGTGTGECETGLRTCQLGSLTCVGGRGPTSEVCNGRNDDCDASTDEAPLPGTGVRCGATNQGACEYGSVVCTAGALTCGGAYVGPTAETCDGIDQDCNGATDDSPAPPTSTPPTCTLTSGVCAGRTPTCGGAAGWSCAFPASYQSTETICDTLDNDCDGTGDEGCLSVHPGSDRRVDVGDTAGSNNSIQPVISGDAASRVYAGWMDRRGGGRAHAYFNRSTDGGDTWGAAPILLDTSSGAAIGPRFGVVGAARDTISTVWVDFRGGTAYREVWRRRSTDAGATWGAGDTRINPTQNTDSFNVDVAVAGNRVYAVYENFTSSRSRHVFIVSSSDGGATFGGRLQVDHGAGATFVAATPKVAAVGTNVWVVWRDNRNGALDVFVNGSTDGGAMFAATDTRLDVGTVAGASSSFAPAVAAEGNNVYVAWVDDRGGGAFDIWLNRSRDSGATWLTADSMRLDADPLPHDSIEPRISAPRASTVVVAWVDYRFGFPDVLVARSTNRAGTFSAPVRVDTGTGPGTSSSLDAALGAEGDLVVVAWADDRDGLLDIYGNFSLDAGGTFQPMDYRLDSTAVPGSSDSVDPEVYVDGTAGHVIWVDYRSGTAGNGDIFYRRLE